VGVVVDKEALGHVFSECFGFPCQSFHQLSPSSQSPGAGTIDGRSAEWTQLDSTRTIPIKKKLSTGTTLPFTYSGRYHNTEDHSTNINLQFKYNMKRNQLGLNLTTKKIKSGNAVNDISC
jgi:hypothetical protein